MSEPPVAIVTGGAHGLGAAICVELLKKGYKVCIADIKEDTGKQFTKEQQEKHGIESVDFIACDVTKEHDFKNVFDFTVEKFDKIDLVVNNAGIILEQNARKTIDVNLMGSIIGCQLAFQYMGKTNGGKGGMVINTASILGFLPYRALPVYTASKHGVIGLTRSYGVLVCDVNDLQAKLLLDDLSEELRQNVKYQKCDVTSYHEFKAAFETAKSEFGKIDILVNNAGIINECQWRKMVDVNFIGVVHGIHLAYSYMGKNSGGSGGYIINTASSQGLEACELVPVYSATKYGVIGLTRSYGHQYHYDKTGIIVNAVCPGATVTALYQEFPNHTVTDAEYTKKFRAGISPVRPEEVAKAALQLLRDGRNGAIMSVDDKGTRYEE